jgi:Ca2+-binding RTX toxin-like protein
MAIIAGTNASETINGTNQGDIILASNGNDTVNGGGGNDLITGGNGNDTLNGGADNDLIDGGNGNDIINGGSGVDILSGGNGNDTLDGGSGTDVLTGGNGNDLLIYRAAENVNAIDIYDGGSGTDTLRLIVTQALANTAAFQAEIAQLRAKLTHGSTSFIFNTMDLAVASIEKLELIVEGGSTNHGPVAVNDTVSTNEDTAITILASALLSNDTDQDAGDTKTLVSVQGATNGTVSLNSSGNVVFQAAANFSGIATFTYTMKDAAGATSTATVTVNVTAVNDAPVATAVTLAPMSEDGTRIITKAQLLAGAADIDSTSGNLTVTLTKTNAGGTLVNNGNDTWTYTPAANDDTSATFSYTVSDGQFSATSTATLDITPVNDAPVAIADTVAATEDMPLTILTATLLANDTDVDVGNNKTFVSAQAAQNGTVSLDSNGNVLFAPDANFSGAASFTYTMRDGAGLLSTASVTVDVAGVADAPTISASSVNGTAGAEIPLNITVSLPDPSEIPVVEIQGVPSSYTLNHGAPTDDRGWLVALSDLADLKLVPIAGQTKPGTLTLHIVATSIDGTSTATTTADVDVTVAPGATQRAGRVVDGYIVAATVFADANGDGVLDAGEAFTTTAADGTFVLTGGSGNLVMFGGTDVSTGLDFHGIMKAPAGSTVVTPLTTLVTALISPTVDAAAAQNAIAAAFGLDPNIDLQNFDPVPAAIAGDPVAQAAATAVLSAAIQVQSTVSQISAVAGSETTVMAAIANTIANATVPIDLSTNIGTIASSSGVTGDALTTVTQVVAAAVDSIQAATNVTQLAQAATVALGEATATLATTNFENTAEVAALTQTYVTDITATVNAAEVGIVSLPIIGSLGADTLTGSALADAIDGQDGDDIIDAGAGNDVVYGGTGRDQITAGAGDDEIDGGEGFDRAIYSGATVGITVQLAAGTVTSTDPLVGSDTLRAVEGIVGTNSNDSFNAQNFTANSTNGGGSGVYIAGGNGPQGSFNEFEGLDGDDTIIGNGGTRISYERAAGAVTVDIAGHVARGTAVGDAANVGQDNLVSGIGQVRGSSYDDTLIGSANGSLTAETFEGWGGNDFIDGNGGFDRVRYDNQNTGALGIQVNLAAGTVTGRDAVGTSVVGIDTIRSIETVRGTQAADVFIATGFATNPTASNPNAGGDQGSFNEFEGMGGDDVVTGNNNTRISYVNSTAGVTVTISSFGNGGGTGTATGNGSVGNDSFTGVTQVRGSSFDDTLTGSTNTTGTESFEGWGGNDTINGGGGFDRARYDVNSTSNSGVPLTLGIAVNMTLGTVTGRDAYATSVLGSDILRSIEQVFGTSAADIYDATNFGTPGFQNPLSNNVGNNGTFNSFQGLGGDDQIIGNGTTQILYNNASAAVTINLSSGTSFGTAALDVAGVGTDIFSGVNNAQGSNFDDTIIGSTANETLGGNAGIDTINGGGGSDTITGGVGNDIIDGGTGADMAIYTGGSTQYAISAASVADGTANRDGTDSLSSVELLQFTDKYLLIASGTAANPISVTSLNFNAGPQLQSLTGADDFLTIGQNHFNRTIDLGGGTDTVNLGITGGYSLSLVNVENVVGAGGDDFFTLMNNATGLSIDLGGGTDNLNLATGVNSLSIQNVENLFVALGNNTLTLLNTVSGVNVNLGNGTTNTLNLAAGINSLSGAFGVAALNGSGSNDVLTLTNGIFNPDNNQVVNLGVGDDTLNIGLQFQSLTALGIEHLNGNALDNNFTINNSVSGITVDLGAGTNDVLGIAGGSNSIGLFNVETVQSTDFVTPSNDTLTLLNNVSGLGVNLGGGTNTLNLAVGTNTLTHLFGVQTVNGTGSGDTLTMTGNVGATTFNLGGGLDTLNFTNSVFGMTVVDIEFVNASAGSDSITIGNTSGSTTITGGLGMDFLTASAGQDNFRYTSVADSPTGGNRDSIMNFNAASDKIVLDGVVTAAGPFHFIGSGVFTGHAEARLDAFNNLQIDVDGNGIGDIEIVLGLTGTLIDANFLVVAPSNVAPSDINLSNASISENSPNGVVVGALTAFDPDPGDTAIFTLLDNAGGKFVLVGTDIKVAGTLDYETATSHEITVRVTDSVNHTYDETLTINVTNVNEAPTNINLSNASIAENSANNTVVGALSAIDPDAGDSATFTLLDNAGNRFAIDGNNLVVNGTLDFETFTSHLVTVRVTDGGNNTRDEQFTISVTNVNEAPTDISLSGTSVAENSATGNVVGTLSGTDPDAGSSLSFSLQDNAGGRFAIVGNNLVVNGALDFEAQASHSVIARVSDGSLFYDETFNIQVTDVAIETIFGTPGDDAGLVGSAGNDTIDGLAGIDRLVYTAATGGVTISMLAGTSSGAGVGSDTFQSIEIIRGSANDDTYNATNFGILPGANTGSVAFNNGDGRFNEFEGMGGNDTITGNGTTRISYLSATAGVTVTMSNTVAGSGTATGNASVGTDTFTGVAQLRGSEFADTITGSNQGGLENFDGRGGNDTINGQSGLDRAIYSAETTGINVTLKTGTVAAFSGTDTLLSIESIRGTNSADTFDATGFTTSIVNGPNFGNAGVDGSGNGFNEFEGMGDNDTITGNGNTRIAFFNATSGVTVTMSAVTAGSGTASGDASVGSDSFTGVNAVSGSYYNDTITGSNNSAVVTESFEGREGDDTINGAGGFDVAIYNNDSSVVAGLTATATANGWDVTGGVGVGHDTLTFVESVRGTNFADTFVATNYLNGSDTIVGLAANFNEIEGMGGDDIITGNGNTRVSYLNSGGSVTVNMVTKTSSGAAGNDSWAVGGGVNRVRLSNNNDTVFSSNDASVGTEILEGRNGSDTVSYAQVSGAVTVNLSSTAAQDTGGGGFDLFVDSFENAIGTAQNDSLTGNTLNNILTGGEGDDSLTGGALGSTEADMAAYSGARSNYTITIINATSATISSVAEATDNLTRIELAQFSDGIYLLNSGSVNVTNMFLPTTTPSTIFGTGGDETLTIGTSIGTRTIDLGLGNDVVNLGQTNAFNGYTLGLVGVETVGGGGISEILTLTANASGLSVNLAGGSDILNLANGTNSLFVNNVESIFGADFSGSSNDILTLLNNVNNVGGFSVNLANGTNTLNLFTGANTLTGVSNVKTINGSGFDDTLTLTNGLFNFDNNPIVDLGAGLSDILNIGSQFVSLSAVGIETLNGNAFDNFFALNSTVSGMTVDLVSGNDTLVVANGINSLSALNIDQINGSDFSGSSNDTLTLLNTVTGLAVNLANGTNTLNLAAGTNVLTNLNNVQNINGSASGDTLTMSGNIFMSSGTPTVDLGGGTDTLNVSNTAFGITVVNIETVNGSAGVDTIAIGNTAGPTTVTAGLGKDFLTASSGEDHFRFTSASESGVSALNRDVVTGFDASTDRFDFSGMAGGPNGFTGPVDFLGIDVAFSGTASEARLASIEGISVLQVDVDGDGVMTADDIEVQMVNLVGGPLQDNNFLLF